MSSSANGNAGLSGCIISSLDESTCRHYLNWVLGGRAPEPPEGCDALEFEWLLVHCQDGVTWGRFDQEGGKWCMGSDVPPDISPPVRSERLLEFRVFGQTAEVLIWKSDKGLLGRILVDQRTGMTAPKPPVYLSPSDESRVIRGDNILEVFDEHGFTRITDGTGAEQVVPVTLHGETIAEHHSQPVLLRLIVRHYYEQDSDSGAVRVAVTRLVGVVREESQ